jgi:hypothetical protein
MTAAARMRLIAAELVSLAAELESVARPAPAAEVMDPEWVDSWTAAERFNQPIDTVRWLARHKGMGVKSGTRWMIDVRAMRRYLQLTREGRE